MSGEPALSSKALNLYLIDGRLSGLSQRLGYCDLPVALDFAYRSVPDSLSLVPDPIPPYPPSPLREEKKPSYMSMVSTVQGGWTRSRLRYRTVTPRGFEGGSVGFETWEQSEALSTAGALQGPQGGIPRPREA